MWWRWKGGLFLLTLLAAPLACGISPIDGSDVASAPTEPAHGSGAGSGSSSPGSSGANAPPPSGTPPAGASAYPIKHVVVVVKENHTFDNYFGSFPGAEGTTTCKRHDGTTFPCPHAPDSTPRDLDHSHDAGLADWNGGQMDSWDLTAGSSV